MKRRVLFVSNGHGEDTIACKVLDRVEKQRAEGSITLDAWPMVGSGSDYVRRSVPIVGPPNQLPSEGFATLDARLFIRDLRAGWLRTHWRQLQAARTLRGRYDLIIAVGDVVPIAVACLAHTPFVFIGCAKSEYYGPGYGYTWLELRWLRRWCQVAFPRDEPTAAALRAAGVRVQFAGNPMMDDLTERELPLADAHDLVIACLPGSRADAVDNASDLLTLLPRGLASGAAPCRMHYVFVLSANFDVSAMTLRIAGVRGGSGAAADDGRSAPSSAWVAESLRDGDTEAGIALRLVAKDGGAAATFVFNALVGAVLQSSLVVGLAGTANEQAVGLGKPLIVLAGRGNQGRAYARMKMRYFGDSALFCDTDQHVLRRDILALLQDDVRRERMVTAGQARMGRPGASDVIARRIVHELGLEGCA